MTILTKPSNEKKSEKVPLPLALGGHDDASSFRGGAPHGTLLGQSSYHSDADTESMVFNRPPGSCIKTLLLFLIAVVVMMMGLLGGYTLYRIYAPPTASNLHYRALCDIPYMPTGNISIPRLYEQSDDLDWRNLFSRFTNYNGLDDDYFREEIELDMGDNESYAKIDVPDFKDGRRGRFMHDFRENQSAIIDTTANRCFIMPLDRDTTLPPKSFLDLMQKMGSGYYNIDTDRVRRRMRVLTPPITDRSLISERIANECYDMKVYLLENYISGVFKREIKPLTDYGKFAEFGGKNIVEFDLINIADIEEYEKKQQ
ncbi:integral membrane protein 2B [Eurosta solidaginis]|uniref:integral membrane protein 2B n=1 Tax=Eurosta solidaginis TaxID=178769 RepID=UPI0035314F40